MRAVNLLPRDLERAGGERSERAPILVAAGGIAVITLGAGVLFMSASGSVSDQRAQLDSTEAAIARIPKAAQPAVATSTLAQDRADRVAALQAALTTRVPLDRLLRELAYVLPDDAWLTGLTAAGSETEGTGSQPSAPPATAQTGTQGVTIQGATYSNRSVARVLARLAALPSLDQVKLSAIARVEPIAADSEGEVAKTKAKAVAKKKPKPIVTFTIAANLRSGSAS